MKGHTVADQDAPAVHHCWVLHIQWRAVARYMRMRRKRQRSDFILLVKCRLQPGGPPCAEHLQRCKRQRTQRCEQSWAVPAVQPTEWIPACVKHSGCYNATLPNHVT